MNFLHPEFLWLAPLVALPIIIHLLNRIRYRRVRWAAMDFLLSSERRAVRRARLQQILLMVLRTLLVACALLALLQPILRGGIAALLGGSSQVAILLDASASMSAADSGGSAFERARTVAISTLGGLPRGTSVVAGTFTLDYDSPFREPLADRTAIGTVFESARLTGGPGNVPQALRAAAESLQRTGGGGTIWLMTDMQASGWRADDAGAWEETRKALASAGKPRIVVSEFGAKTAANFRVASVHMSPAILLEQDEPKLTAAVEFQGKGSASTQAGLFFDGKRVDSRTVEFSEPGKRDCVFHLPAMTKGAHAGYLELSPDALPADDRFYFVLRTATDIPLLVVDGAPSPTLFEGAGDFLQLALRPARSTLLGRSPFSVKTIPATELNRTSLSDYTAVFLADVPKLNPEAAASFKEYVNSGGMVVCFPGAHTDMAAWNGAEFPGIGLQKVVVPEGEKRFKLAWASPTNPVTASLPSEGMDAILIQKMYRFEADKGEALLTTDQGDPFLIRTQMGKGKVYLFAVSGQIDFSTLPFRAPFLLMLHRAVQAHAVEVGEPVARAACSELRLPLPAGTHRIVMPNQESLPITPLESDPSRGVFRRTEQAGIYQLASDAPAEAGVPVAAFNPPPEESELARIAPDAVRNVLPGYSVNFAQTDGNASQLGAEAPERSAASFPLAVLAMAFLLLEVLLAWSIGRPSAAGKGMAAENLESAAASNNTGNVR